MPDFKNIIENIVRSIRTLSAIMLVWLLIIFLLRAMDIVLNSYTQAAPEALPTFVCTALLFDLLFWLRVWPFVLILFIALSFFRPRFANYLIKGILLILTLTQIVLIAYFNTALVPLGADLFGYSLADIRQTLGASSGLGFASLGAMALFLGLSLLALVYLPKRIWPPRYLALALPLIAVFGLVFSFDGLKSRFNFQKEYENNLALNKTDYFISSSWNYFHPSPLDIDIYSDAYIQQFENDERVGTAFVFPDEKNYPFYHNNETPDVLSPFFGSLKEKPNIVIILVEGLGRAFTNEGAYLGNFTPYIDSLSQNSLYWKNFLSNGGRTFAVLPSLMASMPYAQNGMLEMGERMPEHFSLYSLLKHNGYQTAFYYGGNASFDNMALFLKRNTVDDIVDGRNIPTRYKKLPANSGGFSWGYADDQLFSYYLTHSMAGNPKKPQFGTLLTVATHDPFLILNEATYLKRFEERMTALGFDETRKAAARHFSLQYASISYMDESLRNFMTAYRKRADYQNTIFIITGDHRMPEIPMRSKIDRFHVPLLIYSPLLQRRASFESVSSHADIAPSLLAFLKKQLKLDLPSGGSWLGDGLDTAHSFRNIHSYPLIQTKTSMIDFVQGEYHLNGNQLFKLSNDMNEMPVQDPERLQQLQNSFDAFKRKNNQIIQGGKLLPKALIDTYNQP